MRRSLPKEPYKNPVMLYPPNRSDPVSGRLAGLTLEETFEFWALDAQAPFDGSGNIAWAFEGEPSSEKEKRWLELYKKHKYGSKVH